MIEKYTLEKAQEEAAKLQKKIESREVKSYQEAEQILDTENALSPEEIEASRVALEKLKIIMSDDFKEYVIRFVSIQEYEKIVAGQYLRSREVIIRNTTLKNYLRNATSKWDRWKKSLDATDWSEISGKSLSVYRRLLHKLKKIHRENTGEEGIRKDVMKKFREEIMPYVNKRLSIDSPKKEVLQRFVDDPDFLDTKENLRVLIEALSYIEEDYEYTIFINKVKDGQYHLALFLSKKALSEEPNYHNFIWADLREGGLRPDEMLGVAVIMPDKEMCQRIVDISKRSKKFACPVFNNSGIVKFPVEEPPKTAANSNTPTQRS